MANLLSEHEFTERFTDAIKNLKLDPSMKETLVLELHYGTDEPVLTLSLKDVFARYQGEPENLDELFKPFVQDLKWTVQEPRFKSKDIYEQSLPVLRNFYGCPPTDDEFSLDSPGGKGPLVFEDVLKSPHEYIVMQFNLLRDGSPNFLRKGDTLPCIPDAGMLSQLALHNLALCTQEKGLSAVPLQFESLKARSWLIGLSDEQFRDSVAALSCIPAAMKSLEETFEAANGLIAILPSCEQLIVSIDTGEESVVELGMLARQLRARSDRPLSSMIWSFQSGNLTGIQALDLEEVKDSTPT